jgi:hypothetical protein
MKRATGSGREGGAALALALALASCDGTTHPASEPVVRFPTAEELTRGGEADVVALDVGAPPARVEEWTLMTAMGVGTGTAAAESPVLDALVAGRNVGGTFQKTAGMQCAAEELARFAHVHPRPPSDGLLAFVLGRCGAVGVDARSFAVNVARPEEASDDQALVLHMIEAHGEDVRRFLRAYAPAGDREAAAAIGTQEGRVTLTVVVAHRRARISTARLDDGRFVVSGILDVPLTELSLLVNRGTTGVAACERERGVRLPSFRFFCTLSEHDAWARAELVGKDAEGVLDVRVSSLVFFRDSEASLSWVPPEGLRARPEDATRPAREGARVAEGFAAAISRRRSSPLVHAGDESARIEGLARRYLAADRRGERVAADSLARGMLAGWSVPGVIERARLVSAVAHGPDPELFLSFALESPLVRAVLLDPRARSIAIGTVEDATQGARGAVFVVHTLHEEGGEDAAATMALERIAEERRARGLAPATVVTDLRDARDEARRVTTEHLPPRQALDEAMQRLRGRLGTTVKGTFVETLDPSYFPVHQAFLEPGELSILAAAAFHRPEGAAWGQWIVFVYAFHEE